MDHTTHTGQTIRIKANDHAISVEEKNTVQKHADGMNQLDAMAAAFMDINSNFVNTRNMAKKGVPITLKTKNSQLPSKMYPLY